jgi:hypothetical protein
MSREPVICFGQQPCGFFPRRFLFAKFQTARRLRDELGGRLVFFYHDSDHDPRETQTILRDAATGEERRLNFTFVNRIQKRYSPLYAKHINPSWQAGMAARLPQCIRTEPPLAAFAAVRADNAADFCLAMYRALGLVDGMEIVRSSDPAVREAACAVPDFYVDVRYENEIVRARRTPDNRLRLHKGGDAYIALPEQDWKPAQVSPTRDTRLRWMQSVIRCTHYVAGASEMKYLDRSEAPGVTFMERDEIDDPHAAYVP